MSDQISKESVEQVGKYIDSLIHRGSTVVDVTQIDKIDSALLTIGQTLRNVFPSFNYRIDENGVLLLEEDGYSSHRYTSVKVVPTTLSNYAELYAAVVARDKMFNAFSNMKAVMQNVRSKAEYRIYEKLKLQFEGKQPV